MFEKNEECFCHLKVDKNKNLFILNFSNNFFHNWYKVILRVPLFIPNWYKVILRVLLFIPTSIFLGIYSFQKSA